MRKERHDGVGGREGDQVRFRMVPKGECTDRDVARMLELLDLAFERWPASDPGVAPAEHLRWKMSSPAALFSALLGEAGNDLVATEICTGHRVLLRGRDGLRLQFGDHAVRPEWRGLGVSSASIAFRQRTFGHRYDLSIGDAQGAAMIHRSLKFGARPFGNPIRPLLLPLRHREVGRSWALARRLPSWAGAGAAHLLRARSAARLSRRPHPTGEVPLGIAAVECFDPRVDRFFAAASAPWDFLVVRSSARLNWRFRDRRGGAFEARLAEDGDGAVVGYAVAAARGDRGHLADLLALPGRLDVVAALIADLVGVLERAGCVDVLCWLPERHPYRGTLRRAGFLDSRRRPFVTYRPVGATEQDLAFLAAPEARIHFMLGDTDLV